MIYLFQEQILNWLIDDLLSHSLVFKLRTTGVFCYDWFCNISTYRRYIYGVVNVSSVTVSIYRRYICNNVVKILASLCWETGANSTFFQRPVVHLPPLVLNVVKDAAASCVTETSVSQEISDNFFKLNFGSDADSKKFIYCLCRKTNYGNEDGHLNDGFITLFEGSDRKDDIQKVIDDCNKNKDKDNVETMHQTVQCFYKNTPVVLVV